MAEQVMQRVADAIKIVNNRVAVPKPPFLAILRLPITLKSFKRFLNPMQHQSRVINPAHGFLLCILLLVAIPRHLSLHWRRIIGTTLILSSGKLLLRKYYRILLNHKFGQRALLRKKLTGVWIYAGEGGQYSFWE